MVLVNVAANFNTNLYPPEEEAEILANPADVHNRILGSKIVIALEQCMMTSTWGVKLCIWTFLLRLTYVSSPGTAVFSLNCLRPRISAAI